MIESNLDHFTRIVAWGTGRWSVELDRDHRLYLSPEELDRLGIADFDWGGHAFLSWPELDMRTGGVHWLFLMRNDNPKKRSGRKLAQGSIIHAKLYGKTLRMEHQTSPMEAEEADHKITVLRDDRGSLLCFIPHMRLKSTIGLEGMHSAVAVQKRMEPFQHLAPIRPRYNDIYNMTPTLQHYWQFKKENPPTLGRSHTAPRSMASRHGAIPK